MKLPISMMIAVLFLAVTIPSGRAQTENAPAATTEAKADADAAPKRVSHRRHWRHWRHHHRHYYRVHYFGPFPIYWPHFHWPRFRPFYWPRYHHHYYHHHWHHHR